MHSISCLDTVCEAVHQILDLHCFTMHNQKVALWCQINWAYAWWQSEFMTSKLLHTWPSCQGFQSKFHSRRSLQRLLWFYKWSDRESW